MWRNEWSILAKLYMYNWTLKYLSYTQKYDSSKCFHGRVSFSVYNSHIQFIFGEEKCNAYYEIKGISTLNYGMRYIVRVLYKEDISFSL